MRPFGSVPLGARPKRRDQGEGAAMAVHRHQVECATRNDCIVRRCVGSRQIGGGWLRPVRPNTVVADVSSSPFFAYPKLRPLDSPAGGAVSPAGEERNPAV